MSELKTSLEKAGYKKFKNNGVFNPNAKLVYQKCIKDGTGKRYYLTGYFYEKAYVNGNIALEEGIQWEVQFTKNGKTFEVIFCSNDIQEVEGFFNGVWVNMNAEYYELREDS